MNFLFDTFGIVRPGLALAAHLLIALWVTIHVLLRKRDTSASLGWIGLAWLSPVFGGICYALLGINRVKRRARRLNVRNLPRGDLGAPRAEGSLAALEHAIGRITGRETETGNKITVYQNGDEAYPAMLAAIEAAKTSIGLSSYIFEADGTGQRFIGALRAAQERGVAVRVIVDGVGGGYLRSAAYHALRAVNIPARRFLHSPVPWRMPLLNLRSHKKILVVDGAAGFTGGMNIADENVMALDPRKPVQDTHFRIEGPVVRQLTAAFAADWQFVSDEDLGGDPWFPPLDPRGSAQARVVTSGPDRDIEKIEMSVLQAISCARRSIVLMTPYFLPDDQIVTALALAAMRGAEVDVVIPRESNQRLVDWATRASVAPMLREGARLWLGPPPFRHTKLMTVDGAWCLVGSNNWDIRSFRLNFELSMEIYDGDLAAVLTRFILEHKGEPLTLEALAARGMPQKLRDAAVRLMMSYL